MNAYMSQYQNNAVSTASPERLLIMLYDGAIRNVARAQRGLEQGRLADKLEGISKAIAIVAELSNTLNFEIGGEISENLAALYDFMIRELVKANLENRIESLQVVDNLLRDLRSTWEEAIQIVQREKAAATRVNAAPVNGMAQPYVQAL